MAFDARSRAVASEPSGQIADERRSDPGRRARVLSWMTLGGVVLGVVAALDPTTVRPGWLFAFAGVIVASGLVAVASRLWGARWSDPQTFGVVLLLDVLVMVSIAANQDRTGALLNVVMLLPPTLFTAVFLARPLVRGQEAVVAVACGAVMGLVADSPVQWLSLTGLPVLSFVAAAETVLVLRGDLSEVLRSLARLSVTDPLTGVLNRRGLSPEVFDRATRTARYRSVVLLDIDHFKVINDLFGHQAGDRALEAIGRGLLQETRQDDLVVRLGGEEFAVVTAADADETRILAERLRERAVEWIAPWSGTVSIGTATETVRTPGTAAPHDSLQVLLDRADRCLYQAKRAGRNRVVADRGDG
ncbi:GGDEF domain-containing protein [Nakamurella flava]|uniref:GGDEF domain-containing protein n=1 Tax=Nakamurella flava TaxID=2576308 RepID=A0A4U6QCB7_9ACTN|nr:GGDEF domain-containing protein [Nakamurella flava]